MYEHGGVEIRFDVPLGRVYIPAARNEALAVATDAQPVFAATDAGPYAFIPDVRPLFEATDHTLGSDDEATHPALAYAGQVFPESQLALLSTEGSSAVVLRDGRGNVFKVYRHTGNYPYIEDEAGALAVLSAHGLAPRPYALIDSTASSRLRVDAVVDRSFADERVTRVDGGGPLPILVMEELGPIRSLAEVSPDLVIAEFGRVFDVVKDLGLVFGDVEPVINREGRMVFVDVGGTHRYGDEEYAAYSQYDQYAGLGREQAGQLRLAMGLANCIIHELYISHMDEMMVRTAWDMDGIRGIQQYLIDLLRSRP